MSAEERGKPERNYTNCDRCGNEVEDIAVMCCPKCGKDGLCPDCYHDHGCDNFEG